MARSSKRKRDEVVNTEKEDLFNGISILEESMKQFAAINRKLLKIKDDFNSLQKSYLEKSIELIQKEKTIVELKNRLAGYEEKNVNANLINFDESDSKISSQETPMDTKKEESFTWTPIE